MVPSGPNSTVAANAGSPVSTPANAAPAGSADGVADSDEDPLAGPHAAAYMLVLFRAVLAKLASQAL